MRPRLFLTLTVFISIFSTTRNASAVFMESNTPSSAYEALATPYQNSAFWLIVQGGGRTGFDGSGVRINEWYGLVAAHEIETPNGLLTPVSIGMGPSYMGTPTLTRNITSYTVIPGFTNDHFTPDLAIVKFDQPIPGPAPTIGSMTVGETLTCVGYGAIGNPAVGQLPSDGVVRAFTAPVMAFGDPSGADSWGTNYAITDFEDTLRYGPLNGHAWPGDSGGPDFDANGNLVGINIFANLDTTQTGDTGLLRLDQVADWIAANTDVPEPNGIVVLLAGGAALLLNRRYRRQQMPPA